MDTDEIRFSNVRERHAAMDLILHDRIIGTEFFNFTCGELLGSGTSRFVFEYRPDKKYVVKIDCSNVMSNNMEWQIWHEIQFIDKLQIWFAPVTSMSTSGRVMLQRRCKTGIPYNQYHLKIPDFFTDLKYENWGMLNGKMVCFDYASTKFLDLSMNYKLVSAKWWRK